MKKLFKKVFKGLKKVIKPIGKALKKGMGGLGKVFGDLGPIGNLALSLMMPGMGQLWSTFGKMAGGMQGAMGTVFRGVHKAGELFGKVARLPSEILKNTVGAIPIGDGQNLAGWFGQKMDNARMKLGLEPGNINPETAMEQAKTNAGQLGEPLPEIKGQAFTGKGTEIMVGDKALLAPTTPLDINAKMDVMQPKDWESLGLNYGDRANFSELDLQKVSDYKLDVSNLMPKQTGAFSLAKDRMMPGGSEIVGSGTDLGFGKGAMSSGQTFDTTRVVTGFDKVTENLGDITQDFYKPKYATYRTADLSDDILESNKYISDYANHLTGKQAGITKRFNEVSKAYEAGERDTNFGYKDLMKEQVNPSGGGGLMSVAGGANALTGAGAKDSTSQNLGIEVTPLPTDVSTPQAYVGVYGNQFANAGYNGPNTFEGLVQSSYYGGGDMFSFGQMLKQKQQGIFTPKF